MIDKNKKPQEPSEGKIEKDSDPLENKVLSESVDDKSVKPEDSDDYEECPPGIPILGKPAYSSSSPKLRPKQKPKDNKNKLSFILFNLEAKEKHKLPNPNLVKKFLLFISIKQVFILFLFKSYGI